MKNQFRLTVLAFLATQFTDKYEQFNKAFELYRKTEGKNQALEVKLNRVGYTDEFLEALLYDLQKLNDISDVEIVEEKNRNKPVVEFKLQEETKEPGVKVGDLELSLEFIKGVVVTLGIKTSAKTVVGLQAAIDKQTDEVRNQIIDLASATPVNKIEVDFDNVTPATTEPHVFSPNFQLDNSEEEKSLREEFPFLNDEKCPDVMYVVVGKRIAAYKRYQELHAKLQQVELGELQLSEDDRTSLVAETEAHYSENRALWDELNHYATTGEILGKHELFRLNQLKKEVEEMSKEELLKYIGSSATFFSRKNKELKTAEAKGEDTAKIKQAIQEREFKLNLVNEKLGVGK
jgi:hypothetical protein